MSPFNRTHVTSYWRSIVTMALSRVVSEIFNVEKCRDLEIRVRGHWTSLKLVSFDKLGTVSYSCSIVTMSLKWTVFFRYATSKMPWPWNRVKGHWRSSEPTRIDPLPMTSYLRSIVTMVSPIVSEIDGDFSRKSPNFPTHTWNWVSA